MQQMMVIFIINFSFIKLAYYISNIYFILVKSNHIRKIFINLDKIQMLKML